MGPIDYSSQLNAVPSPADSFLQGFQGFNAVRQANFQQQQQQLQLAQQQQLQQDLAGISQNPTPDAIAKLSVKYPQLSEQFKRSYDMLNQQQQEAKLNSAVPVYAALQSGRPDLAAQKLRDTAAAMQNSGQADDAKRTLAWADLIENHPEQAKLSSGLLLSSVMGPDKFASTFASLGQEGRAQDKAPADLRTANAEATIKEAAAAVAPQTEAQKLQTGALNNANTLSQINERAARLGLDKDKLTTDTQIKLTELNQKFGVLPDDARKLVNDSALTAVSSEQQVQQYQQLAGQIDALGGSWGMGSGAHEWLKRATGNEDAVSALKREYTRMASQGVIKLLPPGPASDKDIANAKEGIPNANASPEVMASYLRGIAKLSAYDAVLNNAKAEWAGAVQHLGRAKTDITIDGTKVPAGTTFNEFARTYLATKADALNSAAQVSNRGYMRYASPAGQPGAPAAPPIPPGQLGSGTYGMP